MSCHYDMDFLGIPNVDLSKWKTKYGNDIRLKNVEEIVQDTNLIVKKILSKLEDQEENCEEDHTLLLIPYTLISLYFDFPIL